MKFIMQFSPWSIFLPFRSKYLPQYSVLKNSQSTFLFFCCRRKNSEMLVSTWWTSQHVRLNFFLGELLLSVAVQSFNTVCILN
jgi:hypothetical protein